METLPEAHGHSAEQSQPAETCAENDYGETTEEKGSVPVRQHFVLSNARSLSLPVSLSFIAQGGRPLSSFYITLILYPFGQRYPSILSLLNTCYLGFNSADLYLPIYYTIKGMPTSKGRFTHAAHGFRVGTVFFATMPRLFLGYTRAEKCI